MKNDFQLKLLMILGAFYGGAVSWFENHWEDLVTTAILAFVGAVVSGLSKVLLDKVYLQHRKNDKERIKQNES